MTTAAPTPSAAADNRPPFKKRWERFCRGSVSALSFPLLHAAKLLPLTHFHRLEDERLDRGLVVILPGIDGRSFLNLSILHGLLDAGIDRGLVIDDWTTGVPLNIVQHLLDLPRNIGEANRIAGSILDYQQQYPGRPVHIVGHSGGGALALMILESLPPGSRVDGAVLLAPAISRDYDLSKALAKVNTHIWNYSSKLDCIMVGLGTRIVGTIDRKYQYSAGMLGFLPEATAAAGPGSNFAQAAGEAGSSTVSGEVTATHASASLIERPYSWQMARRWHWGGHLGCVNRVFIAEEIAPLLGSAVPDPMNPQPDSAESPAAADHSAPVPHAWPQTAERSAPAKALATQDLGS
jgi:pimeloyl-ACP methyl ester carboxylesterase